MKNINYDALIDEVLEEYPLDEYPELYSLYASMLRHLMTVVHLKHSTAVKVILKIEEQLNIHLIRDNEMSTMKMINVTKSGDVRRYFRILYWTGKLPLESIETILKTHGDVNCRLVKEYLRENGQMSTSKFSEYSYAQRYYQSHRDELLAKKRAYRQRKKEEKRQSRSPHK